MGREKDDTIGIKHGKPDLIRIGMFSEPLYISSGEAYTPKKGGNPVNTSVQKSNV